MKHIIHPYFFLTHRIFHFVLSLRDKEKTRGGDVLPSYRP
jgi:hypothetical protein